MSEKPCDACVGLTLLRGPKSVHFSALNLPRVFPKWKRLPRLRGKPIIAGLMGLAFQAPKQGELPQIMHRVTLPPSDFATAIGDITGVDLKPPQAAVVKSDGGERCGNGGTRSRQARLSRERAQAEPLMTCRNAFRRCQNRGVAIPSGLAWGMPETAQAASGMEAARSSTRL